MFMSLFANKSHNIVMWRSIVIFAIKVGLVSGSSSGTDDYYKDAGLFLDTALKLQSAKWLL